MPTTTQSPDGSVASSSQVGPGYDVDPQALVTTGTAFKDGSTQVQATLTRLTNSLGQEGQCWGDDQQGQAFAAMYLPKAQSMTTDLADMVTGLATAAATFQTTASNYQAAEAANTLGSAPSGAGNPPAATGQPGSTPPGSTTPGQVSPSISIPNGLSTTPPTTTTGSEGTSTTIGGIATALGLGGGPALIAGASATAASGATNPSGLGRSTDPTLVNTPNGYVMAASPSSLNGMMGTDQPSGDGGFDPLLAPNALTGDPLPSSDASGLGAAITATDLGLGAAASPDGLGLGLSTGAAAPAVVAELPSNVATDALLHQPLADTASVAKSSSATPFPMMPMMGGGANSSDEESADPFKMHHLKS